MNEENRETIEPIGDKIEKQPFHRRFVGKLILSLLFFVVLAFWGQVFIQDNASSWLSVNDKKALGKAPLALSDAWNVGIIANLIGCFSSLCIVYLLKRRSFAPFTEVIGAMMFRAGIPAFAMLYFVGKAGLSESQLAFREWALFYIVIIYLASLPLDIWLVLPGKSEQVEGKQVSR